MRFYDGAVLVKTHPRQRRGGKAIDPSDFPEHRRPYAMRDVRFLEQQAHEHGKAVGLFAKRLLDSPLPWTRMRAVRALLSLCRRYGDEHVESACTRALAVDMLSVHRLERMLRATVPPPEPHLATVVPIARYLRPAGHYALSRSNNKKSEGEEKP